MMVHVSKCVCGCEQEHVAESTGENVEVFVSAEACTCVCVHDSECTCVSVGRGAVTPPSRLPDGLLPRLCGRGL